LPLTPYHNCKVQNKSGPDLHWAEA